MPGKVLDSFALIAYFRDEPGAEAMENLLVTAALIRHGRGILKRKPGGKPLAEERAEHKKAEKEAEDRHAG